MNRSSSQGLMPPATASQRSGAAFGVQLASDDGALTYLVKPAGTRLFMQRTQHDGAGTVAVQCVLFAGHDEFRRWCADEPARFDRPLLFDQLRRCGDDVFGASV